MLNPDVEKQLATMQQYVGKVTGGGASAGDQGWGELGVYRIMFALSLFHALLALIMYGVKTSRDMRARLQNGLWLPKIIVLAGGMTGAFFIPNTFFATWGWIGLVAAWIFIVIQMLLLVDFAHSWNESWVLKAEEGRSCYKYLLLAASLLMFLMSITGTILMFVFYTSGNETESCALPKFFIAFNLILGVITTLASVNSRVQEHTPASGILQAGVVFFYTTYLTWSAVSGVTGPCAAGVAQSSTATIIGAMLTFLAVAYSSLRTSSASQMGKLGMAGGEGDSKALLLNDEADSGAESGDEEEGGSGSSRRRSDNEKDGVMYSWSFFHLTFSLAALYLMEVLTDWAVLQDGTGATINVGVGMSSVWVKVTSSWLVSLLYFWSLIAPICLPNRDFGN